MKIQTNKSIIRSVAGRAAALVYGASLVVGFGFRLTSVAQTPAPDLLVTAATVTRDAGGADLAYVVWSTTPPATTAGKQFAIYAKTGAPDSAGDYARQAVATLTTDPAVIATLLPLAGRLGENPSALDTTLTSLALDSGTNANGTTAQKLAGVIAVTQSKPELVPILRLLGATRPSVAMALGQAWAGPIGPGLTSFELREWDSARQQDLGVVGRVTVSAGAPAPMPAPGAPVQVPDLTPTGDLTIELRWSTPAELRRRAPLQQGFHVWRLPRAIAESNGLLGRAPSLDELAGLAAVRLNELPVFPSRDFDAAAAANIGADPTTFVADDHDRYKPNGVPFDDGAEFAYFVTACDLLGRDGLVSMGGVGMACHTLPPPTPLGLRAESRHLPGTTGIGRPAIFLSWQENTNLPPEHTTFYELYRGADLAELSLPGAPLPANLVTKFDHTSETNVLGWFDDSIQPKSDTLAHTWWYAIRAVRQTKCGLLASALSPPVFGTLRQFEGPEAPQGSLELNCPRAALVYERSYATNLPPNEPAALLVEDGQQLLRLRAECFRRNHGIAWAQFYVMNGAGRTATSGLIHFAADDDTVSFDYVSRRDEGSPHVCCRVGTSEGRTTGYLCHDETDPVEVLVTRFLAGEVSLASADTNDPLLATLFVDTGNGPLCMTFKHRLVGTNGVVMLAGPSIEGQDWWVAAIEGDRTRALGVGTVERMSNSFAIFITDPALAGLASPPQGLLFRGCVLRLEIDDTEQPVPCTHTAWPEGSDRIEPICVRFTPNARAREYRLFRRVEDGPMTLVAQGAVPIDPNLPLSQQRFSRCDDVLPFSGGEISYYAQFLDEHGNASPLSFIGRARVQPKALPVPVLSKPQPAGDLNQPQAVLRWFCPPAGVDRFEISLQPKAKTNSVSPGSNLIKLTQAAPSVHYVLDPITRLKSMLTIFQQFVTPRIGSPELGDGPQFTLVVAVEQGLEYDVFVRAAGPALGGLVKKGAESYHQRFTWKHVAEPEPEVVPWPQRPLPPLTKFNPGIVVSNLSPQLLRSDAEARLHPIGVRIGELPRNSGYEFQLMPEGDHEVMRLRYIGGAAAFGLGSQVYHHTVGPNPRPNEVLLPVVLYRQQVTNSVFPRVSGDVVQVSPRITQLAWDLTAGRLLVATLVDPLVVATGYPIEADVDSSRIVLWLLDTHPVQHGAKYRYWLMRFAQNGEMDVVVPAGEVEVK